MANHQGVVDALDDKLAQMIPQVDSSNGALLILRLAEARAWLTNPNQPHGGSETSKT